MLGYPIPRPDGHGVEGRSEVFDLAERASQSTPHDYRSESVRFPVPLFRYKNLNPGEADVADRSLTHRQSVAGLTPSQEDPSAEFTNVTDLSWPDVAAHPRYAHARGYRQLRGELAADLQHCSYELLARISWLLGESISDDSE